MGQPISPRATPRNWPGGEDQPGRELRQHDRLVATQQLELPVRGYPNRYPFDTYELLLGIGLARVYPDGRVERLGRDEAAGHLFLTLQDQLPREEIGPPAKLDPDLPRQPDDVYELLVLQQLRMTRPLHEQVLAVLLVVLIAAAAAYAVFMRPLHDLVINCGALVIGVWGIRAILSPGTAYRTVVDLALSVVILFLLGAITVRALQFSHARAGLAGARAEPALAAEHSPEHPSSRCDFPGCTNAIAARCAGCGQAFCPRHVAGGQSPRCDACAAAADASGRA